VASTVFRVDPASGEVAGTLDVPIVQAVGDGSLWGANGDAVQRIDPESGAVQEAIPIDRAQDVAIDGSEV